MRPLQPKYPNEILKNIFSKPITYIPYDEAPEAKCIYHEPAIELPHSRSGNFLELGVNKKSIPWSASWDSLPELCLYELHGVYMYNGLVFSQDGRFFVDSLMQLREGHIPKDRAFVITADSRTIAQTAIKEGVFPFVMPPKALDITVVKEPTFYLYHSFYGIGHFYLDSLPRLWCSPYLPKPILLYSVWNKRGYPHDLNSLISCFSLSNEQLLLNTGAIYFFEKLYLSVQCARRLSPYNYVTEQARRLFFKIRDHFCPKPDSSSPKKIFISRAQAHQRRLVESSACEKLFRDRDFFIVYPEKYDWSESIKLFANATHIAGEIGSGILKAFFSDNIEQMFVIRQERMDIDATYDCLLSAYYLNGNPFCYCNGKGIGKTSVARTDDWSIDLNSLEIAIEQWLAL